MAITCFIRYQIDPFQRANFVVYAKRSGDIIPRLGGRLIGYFVPHEGTNDIAHALIEFEALSDYERYRARLLEDSEAQQNFAFALANRLILREQRTFLKPVS